MLPRPCLEYGFTVWDPKHTNTPHTERDSETQNRIAFFLDARTLPSAYDQIKWVNVTDRRYWRMYLYECNQATTFSATRYCAYFCRNCVCWTKTSSFQKNQVHHRTRVLSVLWLSWCRCHGHSWFEMRLKYQWCQWEEKSLPNNADSYKCPNKKEGLWGRHRVITNTQNFRCYTFSNI